MLNQKFADLVISKQFRNTLVDAHDLKTIGYDTETINGKCLLITNSFGEYLHPKNLNHLMKFLCRKKTRNHFGFFFNLKYDFQSILKWLPSTLWETLYDKGELTIKPINQNAWTFYYIPKKFLKIIKNGKKKRSWLFFDISQYYRGHSLNSASEKYLGEKKKEHDYDLSKITEQQIKEKQMIDYCIRDSKLTKRLADHFMSICHKADLYPKNFSSPASIASRYFLSKSQIPTINRFLCKGKYPFLELAWNAISGAFISVFKRGYFDNVYVYDINSAYPNEMRRLPDFSKGKFFYHKKKILDDAPFGWMNVKIKISLKDEYSYHPPFPVLRSNIANYYPVGIIKTTITLSELYYFSKHFDIEVIDGLFWVPEDDPVYPLRDTIDHVYEQRLKTDDANLSTFYKLVLNGMYGKFLERHKITDEDNENFGKWKTGNLFNPFYASYILAGTRIAVFDKLTEAQREDIIACFTDSVIVKKPLDYCKDKTLGEWGFDKQGDALMIGCGVYTIRNKHGVTSKIRGFNTTSKIDLFEVVKKYWGKDYISIDIKSNISPKMALIQKIPEMMNFLIEDKKTVNINFDTKRLWDNKFKCSWELIEKQIDSKPVVNNFI